MKAIVQQKYGSADVLGFEEIDRPLVGDDEVLVQVHAASVNPYDWHLMTGRPYIARLMGSGLFKPKATVLGADLAGRVEAVGDNITTFKPGDEVFGTAAGSYAEYVSVPEDRIVLKPTNLSFVQSAAVGIAAVTAWQALRDKGHIQAEHRVLINGASGGVGTFAVQIAKSFGAEVTGVCSTTNVDMVRSIGADHVIDYTQEDFTRSDQRYDLIVDTVASRSLSDCRRILTPDGVYVLIGAEEIGDWLGPIVLALKIVAASAMSSRKMVLLLAKIGKQELEALRALLESEAVTPVIDRTFPLSEVPQALRRQGEGHAKGKTIITIPESPEAA